MLPANNQNDDATMAVIGIENTWFLMLGQRFLDSRQAEIDVHSDRHPPR